MFSDNSKENVPIIEANIPVEPSLTPKVASADDNPVNGPAEPRASIETLCSLDISDNIPNIVLPMDAEDSPWGGMCSKRRYSASIGTHRLPDVPSRSSSNANLASKAAEADEQGLNLAFPHS